MSDKQVVLSKNVTPTTKRIGIVVLGAVAIAAMVIMQEAKDVLIVVIPVITAVAALIDGGK